MNAFFSKFKWANALVAFLVVCGPSILTYLNDQEWIRNNPQAMPIISVLALLVGLATKFYKHELPAPKPDSDGE